MGPCSKSDVLQDHGKSIHFMKSHCNLLKKLMHKTVDIAINHSQEVSASNIELPTYMEICRYVFYTIPDSRYFIGITNSELSSNKSLKGYMYIIWGHIIHQINLNIFLFFKTSYNACTVTGRGRPRKLYCYLLYYVYSGSWLSELLWIFRILVVKDNWKLFYFLKVRMCWNLDNFVSRKVVKY